MSLSIHELIADRYVRYARDLASQGMLAAALQLLDTALNVRAVKNVPKPVLVLYDRIFHALGNEDKEPPPFPFGTLNASYLYLMISIDNSSIGAAPAGTKPVAEDETQKRIDDIFGAAPAQPQQQYQYQQPSQPFVAPTATAAAPVPVSAAAPVTSAAPVAPAYTTGSTYGYTYQAPPYTGQTYTTTQRVPTFTPATSFQQPHAPFVPPAAPVHSQVPVAPAPIQQPSPSITSTPEVITTGKIITNAQPAPMAAPPPEKLDAHSADTSRIPQELLVIPQTLNALLDVVASAKLDNQTMHDRKMQDVSKRLGDLYYRLNNDQTSTEASQDLLNVCAGLWYSSLMRY